MWTWLASFLGGPVINGLIGAYKAKLQAANTTGAQAADVTKAALLAEIEARKIAQATIVAEQGRWWTALPRSLVQYAAAVFFAKCVVWDTMLGLGETPKLGGDIAATYMLVMGLWFGSQPIVNIAKTIWGKR